MLRPITSPMQSFSTKSFRLSPGSTTQFLASSSQVVALQPSIGTSLLARQLGLNLALPCFTGFLSNQWRDRCCLTFKTDLTKNNLSNLSDSMKPLQAVV